MSIVRRIGARRRRPAGPRRPRAAGAGAGAQSEEQLQCAVADWMRVAAPSLLWTAVSPLPGRATPALGARRRRMGLAPGWPDIQIIHEGQYRGIELKTGTGLSGAQEEVHQAIRQAGGVVLVARSIDDVRAALVAWGVPIRERR